MIFPASISINVVLIYLDKISAVVVPSASQFCVIETNVGRPWSGGCLKKQQHRILIKTLKGNVTLYIYCVVIVLSLQRKYFI